MSMISRRQIMGAGMILPLAACRPRTGGRLRVGVAFETLQTEYWVASFDIIRSELEKNNIETLEAISDGDANRQLEQVKSFVARRVDGVIVAPKDAHTVIPMIKAVNRRDIPIVIYNRPPAENPFKRVTVGTDNFGITRNTVLYLCQLARQAMPSRAGKKHKALILMGDLGDINAIGRRDGFDAAVKENTDIVEVVTRVPTEWNQEKALAGITNGLQAHPDISLVFTSSDFLLPSIVSALKNAGKFHPAGHPEHVLLGAFDGDSMAFRMLREKTLDADGVQDAYAQSRLVVQSILAMRAGEKVNPLVLDPGLVVHQDNLKEASSRMWGAQLVLQSERASRG
jgi:ABC-type sugar transport system substrate-binding protein